MSIYERGLDVSRYQGRVDWQAAAASGQQFAILRLGSSGAGGPYVDPYFLQNVREAQAAGLKVGAYYYTYARSKAQAAAEVGTFLPAMQGLRMEYPLFVDVEDASLMGLGRRELTELVEYAMVLWDQKGWYPGWYTYTAFAQQHLEVEQLAAYPLWVADYRGYVGLSVEYALWQHTGAGRVPGVSGPVDLNYSYRDFVPLLRAGGYNGYGPEGPQMEPIQGKAVEVFNARCEYFTTWDVNAVVGYLPEGRYPALTLAAASYAGFLWVTFTYEGGTYWTALLPDRCRLVDAGDCAACQAALARAEEKLTAVEQLLRQALALLEQPASPAARAPRGG